MKFRQSKLAIGLMFIAAGLMAVSSAAAATIVWVSDGHEAITPGTPNDQGWVELLAAAGYTVQRADRTLMDREGGPNAATLAAADMVIMGPDTRSQNFDRHKTQWNALAKPLLVLNHHYALADRWNWLNTPESTPWIDTLTTIIPTIAQDDIFSGVTPGGSGEITVFDKESVDDFAIYPVITHAGNGNVLATTSPEEHIAIACWMDTTKPFYEGSDQMPGGPRALFCALLNIQIIRNDETMGRMNLTPAGQRMFLNLVAQLSGGPGENAAGRVIALTDEIDLQADLPVTTVIAHVAAAHGDHPAGALQELACAYLRAKQNKEACETYLYLRDTYPDSPEAIWANSRVAMLSLELAKQMPVTVAQEAIRRLVTSEGQMADKPGLDDNLIEIADAALGRQLFAEAGELYQLILRCWPDSPRGITAQTGLITAAMHRMDFTLVEQQYQQLLSRYGDHSRIADKVNEVAHLYERFKMSAKSRDLYSYASGTWPASEGAAAALTQEIRLNILLRDRAGYEAALAKAQGTMAQNKKVAKAVREAADYCYKKKYYDYARELYQVVVNTWPQSNHVCMAQSYLIRRMIGEGDLEAAATAVTDLQSRFAQDVHLPEALGNIAGEYRLKARHDLALTLYDTIIAQPDIPSKFLKNAHRSRLMVCMELGDMENITATAEQYRAAFPEEDLSLSLAKLADSAWKKGLTEAAVQLSNDILARHPARAQTAILARQIVVLNNIMEGDAAGAEGQITAMLNTYAGSSYLPGALKILGDAYRATVDKPRALQLYQLAATMAPTSKAGKKARQAWLKLSVEQGATETAIAEAEALLTDDVTGGGAVEQVYRLATACEAQGQYAQAETLYRQVMANQEMGNQRIHAQAHLAALLDYQGKSQEATSLLNYLVKSHYNHPDFPKQLFMIAERSFNRYRQLLEQEDRGTEAQKCLKKATFIWEVFVNQVPENRITPEGLMFMALCHRFQQQFDKAAVYYQRVVSKYPNYEWADDAQFWLADSYAEVFYRGDKAAKEKAVEAYVTLLNVYPDCKYTQQANQWLEKNVMNSEVKP